MGCELDSLCSGLLSFEWVLAKLVDDASRLPEGIVLNARVTIIRGDTERINLTKDAIYEITKFLSERISLDYANDRKEANRFIRLSWVRDAVFRRDGCRCKKCGSSEILCLDHIIPVSRGGKSDLSNIQLLCFSCNSKKGSSI